MDRQVPQKGATSLPRSTLTYQEANCKYQRKEIHLKFHSSLELTLPPLSPVRERTPHSVYSTVSKPEHPPEGQVSEHSQASGRESNLAFSDQVLRIARLENYKQSPE